MRRWRERVRDFARGLVALGVRPGDHVCLWMPDCIDWVIARWAVPYMGAVLVPINTRFRDNDVGYILRQSDSKFLIVDEGAAGVSLSRHSGPHRARLPRTEAGRMETAGAATDAWRHRARQRRSGVDVAVRDIEALGRKSARQRSASSTNSAPA